MLPLVPGGTSTVPRGEPVPSQDGALMFTIVAWGAFVTFRLARWAVTHFATVLAATGKSTVEPTPWLTATAGMPWLAAARAAPTVPDRLRTGPRFWPRLAPETTSPGWRCSSSRATVTVSAGQPVTASAG